LIPPPETFHCVLAGYADVEQAGEAVASIIAAGLLPGAMEIMDALAMRAAREGVGATYPPGCQAVLIVELDGSAESVAAGRDTLDELLRAAVVPGRSKSPARLSSGWRFGPVAKASSPPSEDSVPTSSSKTASCPAAARPTPCGGSARSVPQSGIPVANVFHAGDGNLHPLIMYDGRIDGALHRAEQVAADIVRLCIELGGSITGEHGVGLEKRDFISSMFDAPSLGAMGDFASRWTPKRSPTAARCSPVAKANRKASTACTRSKSGCDFQILGKQRQAKNLVSVKNLPF
jgi:glycolate oxidase